MTAHTLAPWALDVHWQQVMDTMTLGSIGLYPGQSSNMFLDSGGLSRSRTVGSVGKGGEKTAMSQFHACAEQKLKWVVVLHWNAAVDDKRKLENQQDQKARRTGTGEN